MRFATLAAWQDALLVVEGTVGAQQGVLGGQPHHISCFTAAGRNGTDALMACKEEAPSLLRACLDCPQECGP